MARILTINPRSIRLVGEFDLRSLPQLRAGLEDALSGAGPVVIELDRVTFLDVVSLGAILGAARERGGRGPVILSRPTKEAARLLDLIFDRLDPSCFNVEVRQELQGRPRGAPQGAGSNLVNRRKGRPPSRGDRGTERGSLPRR
jgi:anti-anti-sigma factor